jgi:putative endonuclease
VRPAAAERTRRGADARRSGRSAELLAAVWLMAKGYRILGFRLRTPHGEIDLLALRGPVLAVVEVKRRRTLDEALGAVSAEQRRRLVRAAGSVARGRRALRDRQMRLDLFALAPGARPCHIADAWNDGTGLGLAP